MIDDIESIIQGETFRIGVTVRTSDDDSGLVDADLVVFDQDNDVFIEKTSAFVQDDTVTNEYVADLSTSATDIPEGTYRYFIRINWDDNSNDVVPDTECIDAGECQYSTLIICEKPGSFVVS